MALALWASQIRMEVQRLFGLSFLPTSSQDYSAWSGNIGITPLYNTAAAATTINKKLAWLQEQKLGIREI